MKILLDTHGFLWFIQNDNRLSAKWRSEIETPDNQVFLVWLRVGNVLLNIN
jgi:PIN domain nuclease of toxin-antitoxin system